MNAKSLLVVAVAGLGVAAGVVLSVLGYLRALDAMMTGQPAWICAGLLFGSGMGALAAVAAVIAVVLWVERNY